MLSRMHLPVCGGGPLGRFRLKFSRRTPITDAVGTPKGLRLLKHYVAVDVVPRKTVRARVSAWTETRAPWELTRSVIVRACTARGLKLLLLNRHSTVSEVCSFREPVD